MFSMIILAACMYKNFLNLNLRRVIDQISQKMEQDTLKRWMGRDGESRESFVWPAFKKL